MGVAQLPRQLFEASERQSWFSAKDAHRLLDWLEQNGSELLGIEIARKLPTGEWVLLINPMLDMEDTSGVPSMISEGRRFIDAYAAPDLMFEPVW